MAINLSVKYADQIQQKFTAGSLVDGRLSKKYDFMGANVVKVYTINTVTVNDYDRTLSANRYGVPAEVQDTIQTLNMSQDKSFSAVIDKGNSLDQAINKAGSFLRVQIDEAIIPLMDTYKLAVLAANAGTISSGGGAITKSNVIQRMGAARAALLDNRVPIKGRTWWVGTDVFNALVDTDQFKNLSGLGEKAVINGQVGELFGAPVVEVPASIMPAGTNFLLAHRDAACSPVKINDTRMHIDPPGVSGTLIEGRFYYDCFVFNAKKYGVYADNV